MTGRVVIDDVRPSTPAGYPAKAVVGERVPVRAVVFKEGHDVLAARALLYAGPAGGPDGRSAAGELVEVAPLQLLGNDEWLGHVTPRAMGDHHIVVQAWTDRHATWAHKAEVKLEAGQDVDVEMAEGRALLDLATAGPAVDAARAALDDAGAPAAARLAAALGDDVAAALADPEAVATDLTAAPSQPLWVDRERALVGAWYELFPRSFGGFAGVARRVPALAAMGFDVLYVPPIHPIGRAHRKGRNNALDAGPDDVGSPWAIGGPEGGHTAIHPDLGTDDDLRALIDVLADHGMELALDYALQCSPDHPWVRDHPEWFHHRPDGSIAYAENPPKKYQDIYPINFWPESEADRRALWDECKAVLDHWIGFGVRIFRVDNPHTKPIAFWEWVIPAVQAEHPEVIFLAEAFTRPHVMAKLAEVGFSQSYTYFTWRTRTEGEEGLWAYMEELTAGPKADYMRPSFWPNTPDILSGPLRDGPPSAFALRYLLAATLTPSYGVYSGYELYENQPASPANEEYLNSEKYELRPRDFDRPGSLAPLMTAVNSIRRRHPALQRLRNLVLVPSDNPLVFAYAKVADDGADAVLCAVTLDPSAPQETTLHLDLERLGLPTAGPFYVRDELSGELFLWTGASAYVRLDPMV
ncbi:MAG TPA: alpha-1,4-glucan--maltose-1-phosphate maltosyltransferase, partial [Acidimicrobiales bacterium]|nr:alpha-1,4-glucan--maltose-1-phosphate maltosyltransferase [Acidimicrobiales bacterium]